MIVSHAGWLAGTFPQHEIKFTPRSLRAQRVRFSALLFLRKPAAAERLAPPFGEYQAACRSAIAWEAKAADFTRT
jgi:hypothetical protein